MSKGMNNASGKAHLAKLIEDNTKKLESLRWANTPEGTLALIKAKSAKEAEEKAKMFEQGQLVWCDVSVDTNDLSHKIGSRCSMITHVSTIDATTQEKMLFVMVDNVQQDQFVDGFGYIQKKGDFISHHFYQLEKHVARTTANVWWKVKI